MYVFNVSDYHRLFGMHSILLSAQGLTEINFGEKNLVFFHRTKNHSTIQTAV